MKLNHLMTLLSAAPLLLAGKAPDLAAQQAIASQQGCFRVTFQYEEIEAHQAGYTLAPPKKSELWNGCRSMNRANGGLFCNTCW